MKLKAILWGILFMQKRWMNFDLVQSIQKEKDSSQHISTLVWVLQNLVPCYFNEKQDLLCFQLKMQFRIINLISSVSSTDSFYFVDISKFVSFSTSNNCISSKDARPKFYNPIPTEHIQSILFFLFTTNKPQQNHWGKSFDGTKVKILASFDFQMENHAGMFVNQKGRIQKPFEMAKRWIGKSMGKTKGMQRDLLLSLSDGMALAMVHEQTNWWETIRCFRGGGGGGVNTNTEWNNQKSILTISCIVHHSPFEVAKWWWSIEVISIIHPS